MWMYEIHLPFPAKEKEIHVPFVWVYTQSETWMWGDRKILLMNHTTIGKTAEVGNNPISYLGRSLIIYKQIKRAFDG